MPHAINPHAIKHIMVDNSMWLQIWVPQVSADNKGNTHEGIGCTIQPLRMYMSLHLCSNEMLLSATLDALALAFLRLHLEMRNHEWMQIQQA